MQISAATQMRTIGSMTSGTDALPRECILVFDRPQNQPVGADEFIAPDEIPHAAWIHVAGAVVRDPAGLLIDAIAAEIGGVAGERGLRFLRCRLRSGVLLPWTIGL